MYNVIRLCVWPLLLLCFINTATAEVLPGAKIEYGACNPTIADYENNASFPLYEQSCDVQYITREGDGGKPGESKFWVRVLFEPSNPKVDERGHVWTLFTDESGTNSAAGVADDLFNQTFPQDVDYDDNTRYFLQQHAPVGLNITVGESPEVIIEQSRIVFRVEYESNKACVYATFPGDNREFKVQREFPTTIDEVNDVLTYDDGGGSPIQGASNDHSAMSLEEHCVYAPSPTPDGISLLRNSYVSDVCYDYDSSASRYRVLVNGSYKSRSFTGVVVQCIEETFLNLFAINPAVGSNIFTRMQDNFQNVIAGLLVLYIIFYGLKIVLAQSIPKRSEITWWWLRMCLVLYFAAGTGMIQLYPMLVNSSKDLSAMVLEATKGEIDDPTYIENRNNVTNANQALANAQAVVSDLEGQIARGQTDLVQAEKDFNDAKDEYFRIFELLYGSGTFDPAVDMPPLAAPVPAPGGVEKDLVDKDLELNRDLTVAQSSMTYLDLLSENPLPGAYDLLVVAEAEKVAAENAYTLAVTAYNDAVTEHANAITHRDIKQSEYDSALQAYNAAVAASAGYDAALADLENDLTPVDVVSTTGGGGVYTPSLLCSRVQVKLWGAGSDGREGFTTGNASLIDHGNSGGAGGYVQGQVDVNYGSDISYHIGAGGIGYGTSYFLDEATLYAENGQGETGGGYGGTAATSGATGGNGIHVSPGACTTHSGGNPYGGTVSSSCGLGGQGDSGAGGCYSNCPRYSNKTGAGSDGKAIISCVNVVPIENVITDAIIDQLIADGNSFAQAVKDAGSGYGADLNAATIALNAATAALNAANDAIPPLANAIPPLNTAMLDAHYEMVAKGGTAVLDVDIETGNPPKTSKLVAVSPGNVLPNNQYVTASIYYQEILNDYQQLAAARDGLLSDLADAYAEFVTANGNYQNALSLSGSTGALQADLNAALADLASQEQASTTARDIFNTYAQTLNLSPLGSGYVYCDFSSEVYDPGKESMRLWDMVDCKLATYLGVGLNSADSNVPQSVLVGIAALISSPYGILIFIFSAIFIVFMVMLILRVVNIYLMAFIGVALLAYIAPLIIPAALFKQTKDIFDKWAKEILSRLLQPVILFAFLSLVFGITDRVFFGGNELFTPENTIINSSTLQVPSAGEADLCDDPKALGCIYQTAKYNAVPIFTNSFKIFSIERIDLGGGKGFDLFIALVKMIVMCFVIHAILGVVESLSTLLTGGFGSGAAAGQAATKPPAPHAIGTAAGSTGMAAFRAGKTVAASPYTAGRMARGYLNRHKEERGGGKVKTKKRNNAVQNNARQAGESSAQGEGVSDLGKAAEKAAKKADEV